MNSDTRYPGPGNQGGNWRPPRWPGRARRFLLTAAAGAVLLGGGTAIGIVLTGGASAATSSPPVDTATTSASPSTSPSSSTGTGVGAGSGTGAAGKCKTLAEALLLTNHARLAAELHALCTHPVLGVVLFGGEYGTVTYRGKSGPTTVAFERGTVESDIGSVITVTSPDGSMTWSWNIAPNTVIRQDGSPATVSDGDTVLVVGTVAGGANNARLIRITSTG
ncbi:MAG TPA: hypothetical protein VEH05_12540 [Streptosporangiaceae bacterium]|nr:hypothetical protein [Streptosporangiaceae bacterium]